MDIIYYYKLLFMLKENHHYSTEEYENLVPYERDIIVSMINDKIEYEKMKEREKGSR